MRKLSRFIPPAVLVGLGLLLAACDIAGPDPAESNYVVEAYLFAGERLQPVRVSHTVPVEQTYDPEQVGVSDASVVLERLDEDGEVVARYPYREQSDSLGMYRPLRRSEALHARIRPLATYRLRVDIPDAPGRSAATLTSTTVVPDTFRVLDVSADRATFQQDEQIELTVTPSHYPGRDQAYYVLTTEALADTLREDDLTPLLARLYRESEDLVIEELRISASPILNQANYRENADGSLSIKLPWIAIAFFGANLAEAHAIDDNLYDFLRSQQVQGGGASFAPGEIPNVIDHIEGGTGVFGSMARQGVTVYIERPVTGGGAP